VSLSCGSVWFIDAGSVHMMDMPISSRFLSQDDRIVIADGLGQGDPVDFLVVVVAAQILYEGVAGDPDCRPVCSPRIGLSRCLSLP